MNAIYPKNEYQNANGLVTITLKILRSEKSMNNANNVEYRKQVIHTNSVNVLRVARSQINSQRNIMIALVVLRHHPFAFAYIHLTSFVCHANVVAPTI